MIVKLLQLLGTTHGHLSAEIREGSCSSQSANFSVLVVAREAMISASLDVERYQIHPVSVAIKKIICDGDRNGMDLVALNIQ